MQHMSCKLPSENRDSNNFLRHTEQQRLLFEDCARLTELKEQVSTLFVDSGTQVERKNLTTLSQ